MEGGRNGPRGQSVIKNVVFKKSTGNDTATTLNHNQEELRVEDLQRKQQLAVTMIISRVEVRPSN